MVCLKKKLARKAIACALLIGITLSLHAGAITQKESSTEAITTKNARDYIDVDFAKKQIILAGSGIAIGFIDGIGCFIFDSFMLKAFPVPLSWIFSKKMREELVASTNKGIKATAFCDDEEKKMSHICAQTTSWIVYLTCIATRIATTKGLSAKRFDTHHYSKWHKMTSFGLKLETIIRVLKAFIKK